MIFLREPIKWLTLLTALAELLSTTYFHFTDSQQAAVNGAITVLVGMLGAWAVSAEKALPFIAGLVQAVLTCVLAFNVQVPAQLNAAIMTFVAAGVGMWVRGNVVAPVSAGTKQEAVA